MIFSLVALSAPFSGLGTLFAQPVFPYLEAGPWTVFGVRIESFGLLVWLSLLVGMFAYQRRVAALYRRGQATGRESGLEPRAANAALFWGLLGAFSLSHVVYLVAYLPVGSVVDPRSALDLAAGMSSVGGLLGLIAATTCWAMVTGRRVAPWLDAVTWAAAHGWIVARLGCAFAHDHLGSFTDSWFSVRWPSGLDAFHNPDMLPGRHDLGLVEALLALAIVGCLRVADLAQRRALTPRTLPVLALVAILYAPARFAIEFLRVGEPLYAGLTPAQYGCLVLLAIGALSWSSRLPSRSRPEPGSPVRAAARTMEYRSGSRRGSPGVSLGVIAFAGLLLAAATPARALDAAMPPAWEGDWRIVWTFSVAGASEPHLVDDVTDSICPGDSLGTDLHQPVVQCDPVSLDDTQGLVLCSGQITVPGCSASASLQLEFLRSGDTFTGSGSFTQVLAGTCQQAPVSEDFTVEGFRLATAPSDCGPPAPSTFVEKFVSRVGLAALAEITPDPIFVDGFESGDTGAW